MNWLPKMIQPLDCHLSLPINTPLCVVTVGEGGGSFLFSCISASLYPSLSSLVCVISSDA